VAQAKGFNPTLTPYVLINRAVTNPIVNEVEEARSVLNDFEFLYLSPCVLKERISYRKAAKGGLSIVELDKRDLKAISEITILYDEVFNAV
jgi:chromosome partitioning protein